MIRLDPSVRIDRGTASGGIVARLADGTALHRATARDWGSDAARSRFCRTAAGRAVPVPDRKAAGEKAAAFKARQRQARAERDEQAADLERRLLALLDGLVEQQAKAGSDAAIGATAPPPDGGPSPDGPYRMTPGGLVKLQVGRDGDAAEKRLTNFSARIVEEVVRDDGIDREFMFTIEGRVSGQPARTFAEPAKSFPRMEWVTAQLGARAVVFARAGDEARAGIQLISRPARRECFTHTGWRQVGGRWVYLTAGGAIGPDGLVPGVDVELADPLDRFRLPAPATGTDLIDAVRASLRLLDVADRTLTFPLFAAVYRAPLGANDLAVGLFGRTGSLKSSTIAAFQQHYGATMDRARLPASWVSTGNAIEQLAASAADAFFVVDEFTPTGTPQDVARLHATAERVIRAASNAAGRYRLTHDARMRAGRPPRCLIGMTGEEVFSGESLRARTLIVDLRRGDVDPARLAACQADAAAGAYARAMAGYVRWLAARYAQVRVGLAAEVAEGRRLAAGVGLRHARTPEQVGSLAAGLRHFALYAVAAGALSQQEAEAFVRDGWDALCRSAGRQAAHHVPEDPVARFVELLASAVGSGAAHLADPDGNAPPIASAWGWRKRLSGSLGYGRDEWEPKGVRIGWVDGGTVYLEPNASYETLDRLGGQNGLKLKPVTLRKRMDEQGLLVKERHDELLVRHQLEGVRRSVMQFRPGAIATPEADAPPTGADPAA